MSNCDNIYECLAQVICAKDCKCDLPPCQPPCPPKHCCENDCCDPQYMHALCEMNKMRHMDCHSQNPVKLLIDLLIEQLRKCEYSILIKNIDKCFIIKKEEDSPDVIHVNCDTIIRNKVTDVTLKSFCCDVCTVIVVGPVAIKKQCTDCDIKCKTPCCKPKNDCKRCYKIFYKLEFAKKICKDDTKRLDKIYTKIYDVITYIINLEIRIVDELGKKLFQVKLNNTWYTVAIVIITETDCEKIVIVQFCIDTILYILQNK